MTIAQLIQAQSDRAPDVPAIAAPGRQPLTYEGLLQQIKDINTHLNELGIGRNACVAIVLPNGPEMAAAFLAVAASATSAPLNPNYRQSEFDFYLSDLQAKALMIAADLDSPARDVARSRGLSIIELETDNDAPAGLFTLSGSPQPQRNDGGFAQPDDVALVLHTSGTTSRPKMVPLTHRNLCVSADNICRTLQLSPSDRCLNVMPLFHIHGLAAALLSTLAAGGSVVCTPGFDDSKFFEWMTSFDPTWYTAVPTMHQAILKQAAAHHDVISAARLRFIRSSSAALPPQVMTDLEQIFNLPVIECYGMTEASHQMCSNPLPAAKRKAGSVGLPSGPEVVILDETGHLLPPGQEGEIAIRGANVTAGYANNPSANEASFTNGWFRTGDLGHIDEEGYVYVTGRIKEIINKGGEKVSPREIDEMLLTHPAIAQAVAFAVPHPRLGEDIAAAVVLREAAVVSEQEIQDYVRARLANFKVPGQVVIVEQIPKGPTGKFQRIGLHEKLADRMQSRYQPPGNPTEEKLAGIWSKLMEIKPPGVQDNFFARGGDSLMAVNLLIEIEKIFKRTLPVDSIYRAPTVKQLAALINGVGEEAVSSGVIALRAKGDRPPLFCVAGADGHVISFRQLAMHLEENQPVYGLQYPGQDGQREPLRRIEDIAAEFVREVRRIQPQGPYYLCGHCIGGIVTYEMAQQLTRQEQRVAMLVMLDTYAPGTDPRIRSERRRRRLQFLAGSSLSEWFVRVARAIRQAERSYRPQPYDGKVIIFHPMIRRELSKARADDPLHGWGTLADGGVQTYSIPIRYPDLLREPKVQLVAEKMRACLQEACVSHST